MEEDQNSEVEEVTPQESESNVVENAEKPEENLSVERSHDSDEVQEKNWKESRRKQRESDQTIRTQNELIDKLIKAQQLAVAPIKEIPDEFSSIGTEDYLTMGQTDRRIDKRAEAIAEKKWNELEAKKNQERFVERLQSKYSDFSEVVNPESIAIFEKKEPDLADTIADLKDPYKMGLQTYHFLKKMNVSKDVAENRHAKEVLKKIEKNEKSIQSPQAFNKRPMAQAFQSNGENDSKLYEEMMGFAAGSGGGY